MRPRILIPHPEKFDLLSLKKMTDHVNHAIQDLYKRNSTPIAVSPSGSNGLIWDQTVGKDIAGPLVSIVSPTLDGVKHGSYKFEAIIIVSGASNRYRMYVNNDLTNTNYSVSMIQQSTTSVAGQTVSDPVLFHNVANNADELTITGNIIFTPSGRVYAHFRSYGVVGTWNTVVSYSYSTKISNLTQITISTPTANGIGINSRFRMWRNI